MAMTTRFGVTVGTRATSLALALPLAFGITPVASGQAKPLPVPADSSIRDILKTRVDSGAAMGMIVGITEGGRRRFVAYGSAGPGRPALDEHTLFEIGSISKTVTALLLADAVVRGEARLDEPVAQLLPTGTVVPSSAGRQITLEELATHRSGLPRLPDNFLAANEADPYADYDTSRLYAFLARYQLPRAPGDSAEYSNLGTGLLGHALALHAGAPSWSALVERRITSPLGMRETFVDVPATQRARVSAGYDATLDSVPAWHLDALAGAGALRSTAADVLTYLEAQIDTTRGPLARAIALTRAARADFAFGVRMALGWFVVGPPSRRVWWHNGGTGGFRSFAAFDPERRIGVVVLSNAGVSVDDIGIHLMNSAMPVGLPIRDPRTSVMLTVAELERLVGEYLLAPALSITVTRQSDTLFMQTTGQPKLHLTAKGTNHFVSVAANAELVFDTSEPGRARHVTLRQNGPLITGARKE